jgi:hypothetical protein
MNPIPHFVFPFSFPGTVTSIQTNYYVLIIAAAAFLSSDEKLTLCVTKQTIKKSTATR